MKTRALSFALYILAMLTGMVSLPLVVAGPSLIRDWLPERFELVMSFYWPIVILLCICFLATLYHVSVPVRTNWAFNLPGATFSLVGLDRRLVRAAVGADGRPPRSRGRSTGRWPRPSPCCSGSTSSPSRC